MYEIIFLDEVGEESRDIATSKETFDWKISALKIAGATIVRSGKVSDTDRISPDDIGNDIHDKEEAERWVNPLTEAVQLPVEGE